MQPLHRDPGQLRTSDGVNRLEKGQSLAPATIPCVFVLRDIVTTGLLPNHVISAGPIGGPGYVHALVAFRLEPWRRPGQASALRMSVLPNLSPMSSPLFWQQILSTSTVISSRSQPLRTSRLDRWEQAQGEAFPCPRDRGVERGYIHSHHERPSFEDEVASSPFFGSCLRLTSQAPRAL